jgi:dienelactone hydrolase
VEISKPYIALPSSRGGPDMIVLQELLGINQSLRDICDLYAEEG